MATMIDTLRISQELEDAGLAVGPANGIARAIAAANDNMLRDLVTKDFLKAELAERFGHFETRMNERFGIVDSRMADQFSNIEKRMSDSDTRNEARFGSIEKAIAAQKSTLIGWIIGTQVATMAGIIVLVKFSALLH